MASELVELRGHIVDSLLLPKVLDEVIARDGRFEIDELRVGRQREDPSFARIRVEAPDDARLDEILLRIQEHGAELVHTSDAQLEPAPADGVFPDQFHVTSNQRTEVRVDGAWVPVAPVRMDCGIVVEPGAGTARTARFAQVREGDRVVVGHRGVRVEPLQRDVRKADVFEFMASEVSAEKPKAVAIRAVAQAMREVKASGQKLLLVAGPAVVHTGAAPHVVRLIELGYVDLLFSGNALPVHDIERALYGTALGVHLDHGLPVEAGHQHHLHAINLVRKAGGIRQAVEQGLVTSGIMHACVRHGVEYVLAGSVRDDGPLPDVITDVVEAQLLMAEKVQEVGFALMVATMLHSIATGNMLPATCRVACADINPSVVTKLADRGSFQAVGIVTDVEPFFMELLNYLETRRA
jgi:lysine-ketoglutarate reductase/saccharopine dehydrogenase-like protein (TIGR00300 family)